MTDLAALYPMASVTCKSEPTKPNERCSTQIEASSEDPTQAACACASAIPIQKVDVDGRTVSLAALPLIFEQFDAAGKAPGAEVTKELLEIVKIYNDVPVGTDEAYLAALGREYAAFCSQKESRP